MSRLLFVDDDATLRNVLSRELREFGHEVQACADGETALAAAAETAFDLALIDLRMPGISGMELLRALLQHDPDLPIVVLTGHGAVPEAVAAMRAGAWDFLTKPASLDELEQVVARGLERRRLIAENRRLRRLAGVDDTEAGEILGTSPAIVELRALCERIGPADAHVLVHGENGSGKELVAQRIHRLSRRAGAPLVVVHGGAIPDELVESELFGHQRGAFTGAERRRLGLLEAADGGTLLLDEVGELPLEVQPALLRAVQFGEIRPVGATHTRRVDVRVIAATHRDLPAEVDAGRFREDLYYRLAQLIVEVPPLRARREDVPMLAEAFLAEHNDVAGRDLRWTPAARDALMRWDWPGNVRELWNCVTRVALLASGPTIDEIDVQGQLGANRRPPADVELPTLALHELDRLAVVAAMRKHGGNKRRAAAELGVALKTLYNKLARLPPGCLDP